MQGDASNKLVLQVIDAINALDLDPVKFKLMDAQEGEGWSREYADYMETAYKRFLTLLVKYPHDTIAPTKDIDKFWHGHILDTMKYADDCQRVFGHFLHHFPYLGLRGEEDAALLRRAGAAMSELYAHEFGEPLPDRAAYCGAAKEASHVAYCGAAADADPAYCGAAVTSDAAAYCGAARTAGASAYCGAAKQAADAAYCGATSAPNENAYCGVAKQAGDAAYCGVAVGVSSTFDTWTRPAPAKAA